MKHLKQFLFAALMLSVGLASAADQSVRITKVAGTVQLMKDGVVIMTIKPGDAIPRNLDANITFFVVSGTLEVEAGGMKITGVTGSEFKPTFSGGALVVASDGRSSVVVKNSAGQSVVMASNSEIKMTTTGGNTEVDVQKGRAVVSNPSGGNTQVVNAGETVSFAAAPPIVVQDQTTKDEPKVDETKSEEPLVATEYVPETSVIATQEVKEADEVSGSTPS